VPGADAGRPSAPRTAGRVRALLVSGAVLAAGMGAVPAPGAGAGVRAPAPNDELFVQQWNLDAIGIPRAWDVSTGEGVVVAVLDTGVAYQDVGPARRAPDLAGTRFVPGWDFVDDDAHPDDVPRPGEGSQGTHLAGLIAATTNNALGIAGVAPGAAIMPVRVLGPDGSARGDVIARGLRFAADNGARVANVSLGPNVDASSLTEAVGYAVGRGVTVVLAPGQGGLASLAVPAALPDALTVGAVGYENERTEYSYFGPGLDLVAPGGDVQVDQNRDGIDDGIVAQTLFERPDGFCFCARQGMPVAAAHVSGVAALVLADGRASTPAEVGELLTATAADLGPPGPDEEYGAGLVQATRALGMPPLPGEVPPRTGEGRALPATAPAAEPEDGDVPAGPASGGGNAGARSLFGRTPGSGDSDLGEWLRRRRTELTGLGALVVLGGVTGLVRRRRERRRNRPVEIVEP
jgi:subtilisin family serine protease